MPPLADTGVKVAPVLVMVPVMATMPLLLDCAVDAVAVAKAPPRSTVPPAARMSAPPRTKLLRRWT